MSWHFCSVWRCVLRSTAARLMSCYLNARHSEDYCKLHVIKHKTLGARCVCCISVLKEHLLPCNAITQWLIAGTAQRTHSCAAAQKTVAAACIKVYALAGAALPYVHRTTSSSWCAGWILRFLPLSLSFISLFVAPNHGSRSAASPQRPSSCEREDQGSLVTGTE
jgi:hypothetical protein